MSSIRLGNFSISLTVKDIHASKKFYESLGFVQRGGNIDQNWVVLKNGSAIIGLFQGMFDKNMLTFNPGWNSDAQPIEDFDDVRAIEKHLESEGLTLTQKVEPNTSGPGYLTLIDPDGNPILIDQHR